MSYSLVESAGQVLDRKKLGQILCEKSYLDDTSLQNALAQQQTQERKLGEILIDLGFVTQRQLTETLACQAGIATADLEDISIPQDVLSLVPAELVSKYNILPLSRQNGRLTLAMVSPPAYLRLIGRGQY